MNWKAFWKGVGSVFNIIPTPIESTRNKDVMIAIGEDFKAVGVDLQTALNQYRNKLDSMEK